MNIPVSRGSAATYFRCGGKCCNLFLGNLTGFSAVKEFWKSLKSWHDLHKMIVTRGWRVFFRTVS